jgi:integrase
MPTSSPRSSLRIETGIGAFSRSRSGYSAMSTVRATRCKSLRPRSAVQRRPAAGGAPPRLAMAHRGERLPCREATFGDHPSETYVFHRQGRPWPATKVFAAWKEARGEASFRFHDLRHRAASLMIAAGWSPKRVQVELGHADPAFTLRVYGHLWPDELETGRDQLDAAIAKLSRPRADHAAVTGGH